MKIFILDDSLERINTLRSLLDQRYANAEITVAGTAKYAKSVFDLNRDFDLVFLDHDLGGRIYVNSEEEETGYQVAKHMLKRKVNSGQVIVHTMNIVGAQNICSLLTGEYLVYHIPFPDLVENLKNISS